MSEQREKQAVLMIANDGSFDFLMPLSIYDLEQIRDRMTQHIETAKRQARFAPHEAVVSASENGQHVD